jgi:hypothetical protein
VPGWGQIYTRSKLEGAIVFLSIGILGGGGARADAIYRHFYNDRYTPAVLADSSQADFYFDRANQYYKLSRFLLYTAAGIWAYSIIDAYVDAHIYNARQQVEMLDIDDSKLRQLKPDAGLGLGWPRGKIDPFALCFSRVAEYGDSDQALGNLDRRSDSEKTRARNSESELTRGDRECTVSVW